MFREIEDDPFFAEPFRFHHEHLREMVGNAPNLLGQDFISNSQPGSSTQPVTRNEASSWTDPFNRMSTMMEQIRKEMFDMQNKSIKETRRAVKDSESGIEKMSIGHHIQDRAHVIQKSRNQKTGHEEVDQQFINLNENDAANFDQEWQNKVSKYMPSGTCPSGIQDARKAMEGQSTCARGPTAPPPVTPSGGCGCPAQRNGQHMMKHGRK
ncbi:myeloid leukemia factor 1 isoform X2 [Chiloscyllium punctatum]|uniref:myeloid leukemia factor 1 isoform X2 n=1 Tax=Chiloscyllium punctatum TaxID=137246 RepID=UPI003B632851